MPSANDSSEEHLAELLKLARLQLAVDYPYYAPILFATSIQLANCPSIAGVDAAGHVYFNPQHMAEMIRLVADERKTITNFATILLHELLHFVRSHHSRFVGLDRERAAIAMDCEINDGLHFEFFPEVFRPVLPSDFGLPDGHLAEYYFANLSDEEIVSREVPDEGSGVYGGYVRDWEINDSGSQADGMGCVELKVTLDDVAKAIQSRIDSGNQVPSHARRLVEHTLGHSKIDWRRKLRRRISNRVMQVRNDRADYSFSKRHRRADEIAPLILPGLVSDYSSSPLVSIIVDTSGSISEQQLGIMVREIVSIVNALKAQVEIVPCDDVAYEPIVVSPGSKDEIALQVTKNLRGFGGTSMVNGIESCMRRRPFACQSKSQLPVVTKSIRNVPDIIVVLTDGETDFPSKKEKKTTIIWGIVSQISGSLVKLPKPWIEEQDVVRIPLS